jgi:hypothetical protein
MRLQFKTLREKVYTGKRDKNAGTCIVHVVELDGDSHLLNPRLDLFNHSPTGFEWGYGGSGPAQLALAILADCLTHKGISHDEIAVRLHQQFKRQFVAPLDRHKSWKMNGKDVMKFVVDQLVQREES